MDRNTIAKMAGSQRYQRGTTLYNIGNVSQLEVIPKQNGYSYNLYASVSGSSRKRYNVEATYDAREDELKEFYCGCMDFAALEIDFGDSSDGSSGHICKHCVAMALHFIDEELPSIRKQLSDSNTSSQNSAKRVASEDSDNIPHLDSNDVFRMLQEVYQKKSSGTGNVSREIHKGIPSGSSNQKAGSKKAKATRKVAVSASNAVRTTPSIYQLLMTERNRQRMALPQQEMLGLAVKEEEKVKIVPSLQWFCGDMQVDFRIGRTQLYVLKNISAFLSAIDSKSNVHYGKNLEFVHTEECFDEKSRKILAWMRRQEAKDRNNRSNYYGSYSYYYNYNYGVGKTFYLDNEDIEAFLLMMEDALQGEKMSVFVNGEERHLSIQREDVSRKLWIVGHRDGNRLTGITVQPDGYVRLEKTVAEKETVFVRSMPFEEDDIQELILQNYIVTVTKDAIHLRKLPDSQVMKDFIEILPNLKNEVFCVNREDIPMFCQSLLPELKKAYELQCTDFDLAEYELPKPHFEIYLDAPQPNFITGKCYAVYPGKEQKYNIYDQTSNMEQRNLLEERACRSGIMPLFEAYDENNMELAIADEDSIFHFLKDGIGKLQAFGEVFISDKLKRLRIMTPPSVQTGVSLVGDLLEINVTSGDVSLAQLAEILSKYQRKKKYFRLKSGEFVNMETDTEEEKALLQNLEQCADLASGLGLTEAQLKKGEIEIPKYRALYLDQFQQDENFYMEKNEEFRRLVGEIGRNANKTYDIPEGMENILRDYQKEGYYWFKRLSENGFGGILADDMGLGKTLQMITYLKSEMLAAQDKRGKNAANRRSLIVCPASLVYNWRNEFRLFAGDMNVQIIAGSAISRKTMIEESTGDQILITSYDLLKRDLEYYDGKDFYCQVIDEAQYIKNHNTQVARAVKAISAVHRFALTGTPIENRVSEMWSIFDYLMPGFLYSYQHFHLAFENEIMMHESDKMMEKLKKMITPFILRRLKKEVLKDLPDKLEETYVCEMKGEQQKLYDAHVQRLRILLGKQTDDEFKKGKIEVLSEITRLRQLCCDPALVYEDFKEESAKKEMCIDLVKQAIEGGHKILIFSQFTSMLDLLQKELTREKIAYYTIQGSTQKEQRVRLVEEFNKEDNPVSVFCISLKAGGTGLNLTGADIVIHYDPWWNVAAQNQATDRAHRIGQKNVVTVYKLVEKGTIEEKIVELQERKKELADQLLGSEDISSSSLSREDLLELLR